MSFAADYPGAIVVPAHPTNWYERPCTPKGWVLHTPEETADSYPGTPYWFQTPNISASTHYFVAYDGRIFQMVEERYTPIANGVLGKPYPAWADPSYTLNGQTLSVEIEGRAASIHWTLRPGTPQWVSTVRLIRARGSFPKDREHVIGHYQVANNRTDPGAFFPWDALMAELGGDEMWERLNGVATFFNNRQFGPTPANQPATMQLAIDFPHLPATAKAVDLEVFLTPSSRGKLIFADGDGRYAGQFNAYRLQGIVRVVPKDRQVKFAVEGNVTTELVGLVGYVA